MKKICILIGTILTVLFLFSCEKKPKYDITYDLDGGYFPEEEIVDDLYNLPTPLKDGYVFIGWQEDGQFKRVLEPQNHMLKAIWANDLEYQYINDEEILLQDEMQYYVYFMKDGCSWCEKIKEEILRYQYISSFEKEIKKLYVVNLRTSSKNSIILRTYETQTEEIEGFYVENAKKWDDLYIPSTPALIEVTENNNARTMKIITNGSTNIKKAIINSLQDQNDYNKLTTIYNVTYDLNGGFCDELVYKFNIWTKLLLPIPTKEGYFFGGWLEDNIYVTKTENKNYSLKATWVDKTEIESIEEKDIFNKGENYYIFFLKESDDNSKALEIIKKYNALTSAYNLGKIYIVNLEKCDTIYRAYIGDDNDTNKVDGVTTIDDLYISRKRTMIQINNGEAAYITNTTNGIIEYLEEVLSLKLDD